MTEPEAKIPVIPAPAATVILIRPASPNGIEVYLTRRNRKASFMAGAFVFPGGRVDDADKNADWVDDCVGAECARGAIAGLSLEESAGHHIAAIRELFEEAGVLIGINESGDFPTFSNDEDKARLADWRRKLYDKECTIIDIFRGENLRPTLDRLHYVGHWITPSQEPKRFDARFFLAALPPHQEPVDDGREVFEGFWVTPSHAIERSDKAEVILPPPTLWSIWDLAESGIGLNEGDTDLEADIAGFANSREVETFEPLIKPMGKDLHFVLPQDPAYDNPELEVAPERQRRVVFSDGAMRAVRPT